MKKKIYSIVFFLGLTTLSITSQAQDVKIYTLKGTKKFIILPPKHFWRFYKVDMKNKTIQWDYLIFDKGSTPNLTNLFNNKTERKFIVKSKTKIKIPRIKGYRYRVKRSFFDIATPGSHHVKGKPSETYFIRKNTFRQKKRWFEFFNNTLYYNLDTVLTKKFNLKNPKIEKTKIPEIKGYRY